MDLSVRREVEGRSDNSWLGSAHGTDATQTISVDTGTFTAATHYPDGYLVSGLPLAVTGTDAETGTDIYGLWTVNATTPVDLAGFLYTDTPVPVAGAVVGAAILEHGRVKADKLPVSVDDAGMASASGRIIFA